MFESILILVLAAVALLFIDGTITPPLARGRVRAIRQRDTKVRFSMRALLIAVTLIALACGLLAWLNHAPNM